MGDLWLELLVVYRQQLLDALAPPLTSPPLTIYTLITRTLVLLPSRNTLDIFGRRCARGRSGRLAKGRSGGRRREGALRRRHVAGCCGLLGLCGTRKGDGRRLQKRPGAPLCSRVVSWRILRRLGSGRKGFGGRGRLRGCTEGLGARSEFGSVTETSDALTGAHGKNIQESSVWVLSDFEG